jgi:hypothetical protein
MTMKVRPWWIAILATSLCVGTAAAQVYLTCDASTEFFPCLSKPGSYFVCLKPMTCPAGSKHDKICTQWKCWSKPKPPPPKCKPACKTGYICVVTSGGGETTAQCQKKAKLYQ